MSARRAVTAVTAIPVLRPGFAAPGSREHALIGEARARARRRRLSAAAVATLAVLIGVLSIGLRHGGGPTRAAAVSPAGKALTGRVLFDGITNDGIESIRVRPGYNGLQPRSIYELVLGPKPRVRLLRRDAAGLSIFPEWSPDRTQIAFGTVERAPWRPHSGPRPLQRRIMLMTADGRDQRPLTPLSLGATDPAWSPDGSRIAFTGGKGGIPTRLFVIDADGSGLRAIATGTVVFDPSWSPDGRRLAYSGRYHGKSAILVTSIDGGAPHPLVTRNPNGLWAPAWSRSGTEIAYLAGRHLMLMQSDGADPRPFAKPCARTCAIPRPDSNLVWSPDGTRIAFTSMDGSIWTERVGVGTQRRLTGNRRFAYASSWRP